MSRRHELGNTWEDGDQEHDRLKGVPAIPVSWRDEFRLRPGKRNRYLCAVALMLGLFLVVIFLATSGSQSTTISDDGEDIDGLQNGEQNGDSAVAPLVETDPLEIEQEDSVTTTPVTFASNVTNVNEEEDKALDESDIPHRAERCRKLRNTVQSGTKDYELASANCGWGYNFTNSSAKARPWKVVLFGPSWSTYVLDLAGFLPNECPLSPKCTIIKATTRVSALAGADVVVIFQSDAVALGRLNLGNGFGKPHYKVLYYRETRVPHPPKNIQRLFDFQMGVHFFSALLNPHFLKAPAEMLNGPMPSTLRAVLFEDKTRFAIAIVSDCNAPSLRDLYINLLSRALGPDKLHHYGACGDKVLPPKPINNAFKVIASYKFFLAFENEIQQGYVTEKLFWTLAIPGIVPVYYGALDVPNITTTPSFIRAADFSSPKHLAEYLLHLDNHPDEYNQYLQWKKDPYTAFTPEYLELVRHKVAGPEEVQVYYDRRGKFHRYPRTAQACRLCDANYVKWAAQVDPPGKRKLVETMSAADVRARFFRDE